MLAITCAPLLEKDFFKSIGAGVGALLAGIGSAFGFIGRKSGENDDNEKRGSESRRERRKDPEPEDEMTDEQKRKAAMVLNANMLKENLKKKQSILEDKKKALEDAKDEDKEKLEKEVKDAEEAVKSAQQSHDTFLTCGFDDEGQPVDAETFKANLKKSGMDEDTIKKLESESSKVKPEDFENSVKEHCSNIIKDGKIDEHALGEVRDGLKTDVKAAKERIANTKEDSKEEPNKKDKKEAATKTEHNKNREDDNKKGKSADDPDKDTDKKKADRLKQIEDKWTKASEEVEELEKKLKGAKNDEKKDLEAQLNKKKKLVANLEKAQKKLDDNSEKEYEITHNGKKTTIIKRAKKRGEGSTWCYKNDRDQTISADIARAMLKASGVKEGLTLAEWLTIFLD